MNPGILLAMATYDGNAICISVGLMIGAGLGIIMIKAKLETGVKSSDVIVWLMMLSLPLVTSRNL